MVIGCVLAAMLFMVEVNLMLAIVLTVVLNLDLADQPVAVGLHTSLAQRQEFLEDSEAKRRHPGVHKLIHQVADEYRFEAPRIGFISDRHPTAFTYGLLR